MCAECLQLVRAVLCEHQLLSKDWATVEKCHTFTVAHLHTCIVAEGIRRVDVTAHMVTCNATTHEVSLSHDMTA